ncbi:KDO2-lipid IV(A) lauroyltransferase [Dokdonella fugitiva]|uniref:KDO2-lipid IV(A) lauroyltransferase n=1 Tax=Dokdonella fugitiva TaxID=328517 RepID=A0A839F0N6_9GAMM|nr:lipid A biosynthesis acyltransferase [Dokdonella fugitiva]MBA8887459.1 KDO2-lipid IV(A) lauroyltransferase [Dokdonella fugitiva]
MPSPALSWPVALLYGSLRLVGRCPLRLVHALGGAFGWLSWLRDGRTRRIAERNLSLVLTQESAENRQRLARASLVETGKALAEVAAIWGNRPEDALALVREVRGRELFDAALAAGRGLIVAAPHLGCWELLNYWLAAQTPLAILYRAPRHAVLEPLLLRARGALPVEQVRAEGAGVRTLYKRLAAGGVVGILPDQQPRQGEGAQAPFFGVPAPTMVLLPRLAERTGACVLFSFVERLPHGAGFRVHFLPAPAGIADPDIGVACTALNRGVEDCVRLAFAQYQWTYKRWPNALAPTAAAAVP